MNKTAAQRQSRPLIPDFSDFLGGFPALSGLRPLLDGHVLRVEDDVRDGLYRLPVELPGVDPAEDIEISVRGGRLTVKADRNPPAEAKGRSEFAYGSFTRSVALPSGADEDDIDAVYDRGILTISVPVGDDEDESHDHEEHVQPVG